MSAKPKAIIIGAGIAGLATAIRLAMQGFEVEVFEKNNYAGGKISAFNLQGYQFDEGPSLFTQPQNIADLFELAGEPIEDYFSHEALPIACKYFFENGKVVNAYTDAQAFAEELAKEVGEDPQKVLKYLKQSKTLYERIGTIFLNYSLHKIRDLLKSPIIKAFKATRLSYLFQSLNAYNKTNFNKPETVQLFNRFATYNGSNPYKAPAMLSLIPHLEQNQGTFYPKGGMISIANAVYNLALRKGVKFQFNTTVQHIINNEGRARGIVTNNTNYYADVVVSNMDVYFTYKHLLGDENKAKNILKQERSSSAIIFYWGMKKQFPQLQLHNIFFSNDYKKEFDHLFRTKTLSNDPTIYVNITSKMESDHAPEKSENWFVMVNAPANSGQNWRDITAQSRKSVIQKLNGILQEDIEALIEVEQVMDPVIIEEKTSSCMGSLYGTSSNGKFAAFLRHSNFSPALKGLYFVGGSVHPGGGIPLCLLGAKIVGEMIKDDRRKRIHH